MLECINTEMHLMLAFSHAHDFSLVMDKFTLSTITPSSVSTVCSDLKGITRSKTNASSPFINLDIIPKQLLDIID